MSVQTAFTPAPPPVPPTTLTDVDEAIESLDAKKAAWLEVSTADRALLLEKCVASIAAVAEKWAEVGAQIKGIAPTENLAGEEWLAGVMPTIRNARMLANALRHEGRPRPVRVRTRPDGRTRVTVFPSNVMERLMFAGFHAEVWIEKDKPATQGAIYSATAKKNDDAPSAGRICLVLGGGNVSSIPPMDVFYKLFVENEVVLLKMNPVNEALGPILGVALAPLVEGGWLSIIYGGAEVGGHAAAHPKIGSLHVTGSDRTYDAIVWGGASADERANRKAKRERANEKPFSAELGCVTPVIVVPGPWSAADIRFQARHVAAMVTQNASFNCNAAKVVIVAREWLQREAFLEAFHEELAKTPARKAYYPGAKDRYAAFMEHYPDASVVGASSSGGDAVPWTVIRNVAPPPRKKDGEGGGGDKSSSYALSNEAFCGIIAELTIDAPDFGNASVPHFIEQAVKLANDSCWGTLSCCLLVHPETAETHTDVLTKAVADLRYGGIGINVWPGVIYGLVSPTWGAYPGHTPEDIQSGTGVVHNTWLFDHPEKSVVRGPFRIRPTPAWFSDHKNLLDLGRKLVRFEAAPSWKNFFSVSLAAMKG